MPVNNNVYFGQTDEHTHTCTQRYKYYIVWCNRSTLVLIKEVNLRQVRLVLGCFPSFRGR